MSGDLEAGSIAIGVVGGLALFLMGMGMMADALKLVAGDRMREVLARLTTNRFTGALTGALVTGVVQSSSVTTVLVVGFVSAGLMPMAHSVGVIMGANIGTTLTGQIVAFKVTRYALLMVAAGFAMTALANRQRFRHYGSALLGLGLIFFGMAVMGDAMEPLQSHPPFIQALGRLASPWVGILAGAGFTALIQSSSATTGIVIVLAAQGLVTLPAGIALLVGANIGTCVTALLATLGRPRDATRAAVVHVLFNVVGAAIWLPFLHELAGMAAALSPASTGLAGLERAAADAPRQIANAHTIFNVANTLLFIGFVPQIARFVHWLVPDRPVEEDDEVRPRYLDRELLRTPSLALDRARLEILRLGARVRLMVTGVLPAMTEGRFDDLEAVRAMDDAVDTLHGHIVTYLGEISQTTLAEDQTADLLRLMEAVNDLESIGDIVETILVGRGLERLDTRVRISPATREVIEGFHGSVLTSLDLALKAVGQKDPEAASAVVEMKSEINRLSDSAALHEVRRLVAQEPNRLAAYTVEVDMLEGMKRIYYFCKRMARTVLPPSPEGSPVGDPLRGDAP
jgi:phosphate:Na+ symporter